MRTTINSTIKGKAYEYACVLAIKELVTPIRPVEIIANSSLEIAEQRYNEITQDEQAEMLRSAKAGMSKIIEMEPKVTDDGDDKLTISLQPDNLAKGGDIRDVLIIRRSIKWEIGVSVKHNHEALKHSRLSMSIDFGKLWLGANCSKDYFTEIKPLFDMLSKEKSCGKLWSQLPSKENAVYVPLLTAFKNEFIKLNSQNEDVTENLIRYLLGSNGKDYYKLIHRNNNIATIIPFNLFGTLNTSGKNKPTITIPNIELPTRIIEFDFKEKSQTTLILTMNNGWSISFRIHNASSKVETSLKFDINLQSKPEKMFYIDVKW
ncbi:MAG: HaeIII family restriction endonuclease [Firmicutes bacterium]|nr:HaeIII family restriction endonuclease [Bacillota bacterium]MCL2228407.1 HaeIII family restriction endonuclease [Bacillota bacterium]